MKPINSQCQMIKFWKFAEKLTATQSMSSVTWNIKCVTKKKHIGKTKRDNTKGFKVRINQHISDCKTRDSTCFVVLRITGIKNDCFINNICLEEPFFSLHIMLRLNKSDRPETIESISI